MRDGLAVLTLLAATSSAPAQAPSKAAASPPVIACASLANLRAVLRTAKDDAAAVPIITDPKSDLGCNVLDPAAVTGLADHVALNGKTYDCLALRGTSICQWTVAGRVVAPSPGASPPSREKPKRP